MNRRLDVVGAVIVNDGRMLAARRGPSGALPSMWEFPGGKVENDESHQEALASAIREELRVHITVGERVLSTTHEYDFGIVTLTTFFCELPSGAPQLAEHCPHLALTRRTLLRRVGTRRYPCRRASTRLASDLSSSRGRQVDTSRATRTRFP